MKADVIRNQCIEVDGLTPDGTPGMGIAHDKK